MKIETLVKFTKGVVRVFQMVKKCIQCDTEFNCKTDDKCWCFELPKILNVDNGDCLCRKCLNKKIENEKNKI